MWLVTGHEGESRSPFDGALDVDVMLSPFFNALSIRRLGLQQAVEPVTVPVLYVYLPDLTVAAAEISYSGARPDGHGIKVSSPAAETSLTVDADGFILDYPGLAERI